MGLHENTVMMRSLIAILLSLPLSVLAQTQVPNVFEDGTPASAAEVNENFQYVLENASGGCSVEQVDNTAEITCADGTTAVVPGYGTVVVYPEGLVGEVNVGTVNTGDIVIVDDADVVLGPVLDSNAYGFLTSVRFNDDPACQVRLRNINDRVELDGEWSEGFFQSDDCSGVLLIQRFGNCQNPTGEQWVVSGESVDGQLLTNSRMQKNICSEQKNRLWGSGELTFTTDVTLPSEILNAAYPVRLEQLP